VVASHRKRADERFGVFHRFERRLGNWAKPRRSENCDMFTGIDGQPGDVGSFEPLAEVGHWRLTTELSGRYGL
jgi:hypothetical protein